VKSAKSYTEAAEDEIKLLRKIAEGDPERKKCVVHLLDYFDHRGPNGRHIVMSFEVLGSNLLDLIKYYDYKGIPTKVVKSVCKQVLIALDYLHTECGIIHTDLKPENVLLSITLPKKPKKNGEAENSDEEVNEKPPTPPPSHIKYSVVDENDPSTYIVKIADFGNACWVDHHFTNDIQTRQYRAPEVILGSKYGPSVDMWSMGCMVFELLTGDLLFEPKDGQNFDKNDDHLAQMIELLGKLPKKLTSSGKYARDFFNRKGELKFIRNLNFWSLDRVLTEKYHRSEVETNEIVSFILPMLNYYTEKRATAALSLKHSWLQNVPPFLDEQQQD
jgi:serine/threonine-protein kinase SRPK3